MVAAARPTRSPIPIDTNLSLFAPDPAEELQRAKAIVREIAPLDCGFARSTSRGWSFWLATWSRDGKQMRKYIGNDAKLAAVKAAQQLVRDHMLALGLEPPPVRRRPKPKKTTTKDHAAPPRGHKSPTAAGGGRRLAASSLRDSENASATSPAKGRSLRRAGAGSRRRP